MYAQFSSHLHFVEPNANFDIDLIYTESADSKYCVRSKTTLTFAKSGTNRMGAGVLKIYGQSNTVTSFFGLSDMLVRLTVSTRGLIACDSDCWTTQLITSKQTTEC